MKRVMVRYTVKPDRAVENEDLIRAVYAELHEARPTDLRYATFKLEDGVTFIHIAASESEGDESPLSEISAFKRFQQGIHERWTQPTAPVELTEIGSFRFFED